MNKIIGPDGYERTPTEEARLNVAAVSALGDAAGKEFMDYLRSITIERVCGPNIDPNHLMHLEGMRYLVGIISQRIAHGHKEKSNGTSASSSTKAK